MFFSVGERLEDAIFFLTSFFNNSIHSSIATNHRCELDCKNRRENRKQWQQKRRLQRSRLRRKRSKLTSRQTKRGTQRASPKVFWVSFCLRGGCLERWFFRSFKEASLVILGAARQMLHPVLNLLQHQGAFVIFRCRVAEMFACGLERLGKFSQLQLQ